MAVTHKSIGKARDALKPHIRKTPIIEFGSGLYLKLENIHPQVKGFKIRGAFNRLLTETSSKVITAAIGTHGFAVGVVCRKLGKKSICFMPHNAPQSKKDKMEKLVDEVIYSGDEFSETETAAMKYASEEGLPFIHPYNDGLVIQGQGTIGLEIFEDMPDVSNVYIPVGGGGLISGVAVALKALNPRIRIVGVQPEDMHAMKESIHASTVTRVKVGSSIAEPLCINLNPDTVTFGYASRYSNYFFLVDENSIKEAMLSIFEKTGHVVEGAGAIAMAAALLDPNKKPGKSVCIVSGGNVTDLSYPEECGTD